MDKNYGQGFFSKNCPKFLFLSFKVKKFKMSLLNYFKRVENPPPNPEEKKKHSLDENDDNNVSKKLKSDIPVWFFKY